MNTQKETLDLRKVESIVIDNLEPLLDELGIHDYTEMSGSIFMCCPIHGSDNNKSLSISLDKRCWSCWSRDCHEDYGNSIFDFVRGVQDCSFSDALRLINQVYNLGDGRDVSTEHIERTDLHDIVKIFTKREEKIDIIPAEFPNTTGRSLYFESRGFKRETLKDFGVEDCAEYSSPMYRRAIIPIYDEEDQKVSYIARRTEDFMEPKYLYSKNGFKKSQCLYNYNRAIKEGGRKLYVTEGQGDVWRLCEAGVTNCVGLFGKDISEYQKGLLLTSGFTTLSFLLDNDQAGREAKMKVVRKLNRLFTLAFPPMSRKDIGEMSIEEVKEILK
jgi:DNA primase